MKHNVTFLILIFVASIMTCSVGFGAKDSSNKDQKTISAKKSNDYDVNRIAFKFYADTLERCNQWQDNIVVAPFSGLIQMNGLVNATESKSLSELLNMLEFKGTKERWNNKVMLPLAKQYQDIFELQIANSIWVANDFKIKDSFIAQTAKAFSLYAKNVDFANPQTTSEINNWFADNTYNKVINLFDSIPTQTKVILGNALYFHGQWKQKFDPEDTAKGFFTTYNNKEKKCKEERCKIMDQIGKFFCYQNEQYKVFKMSYEGDRFYMLVFIPNTYESFPTLEKQLSSKMISEVEEKLEEKKIHVRLPKFTSAGKIDMIPFLSKNGVKAIFNKDADFSGLSDMQGEENEVLVSQMFQQVVIDIDEQGTEAAATGVTTIEPKQKPENFYADRPFVYLIKDAKTSQILFIGRFVNPKGNGVQQPLQSEQSEQPEQSQPEKEPTEVIPEQPNTEPVDPKPTPTTPGHESVF